MDKIDQRPITELAGRDLDLLMAFRAVAEAGGITAAERRLGLERSVISRQVKSLEERLGGRLCHRGPSGFELTELGKAAVREASAVHDLFHRLNSRLGGAGKATGSLTIAVADHCMTNERARVPQLLEGFVAAAPDCRLALNVMAAAQIREALRARRADIAISGDTFGDDDLAFTPFFAEDFRLYTSVRDGEEAPHLADLSRLGYGLVVREGERSPGAALALPLDLAPRVNASGLEAVALFLATGRFAGLLPTHLAAAYAPLLNLREVKGACHLGVSIRFGFTMHVRRYRSATVERLFDVAERIYAPAHA